MDFSIPSPASSSAREAMPADTSSSPRVEGDSSFMSSQSSFSGDRGVATEETERHPKGRRKRTAAKDKAVLEAAYSANPKPDKTARLEIVERVSLNEKEVQIWFQNRRQNDRRKSRPLSPQEVAALQSGGMQILSNKPIKFGGFGQEQPNDTDADESFSESHHDASTLSASGPAEFSTQTTTTPAASPEIGPWIPGKFPGLKELLNPQMPPPIKTEAIVEAAAEADTPEHAPAALNSSFSQSFSSSVSGHHVTDNDWNAQSVQSTPTSSFQSGLDSSFSAGRFVRSSSTASTSVAPFLPPPLPRSNSASQVRLSLSLEGKASVVSMLASPSPPRPSSTELAQQQPPEPIPFSIPALRRSGSLHRSQSAVSLPPFSALAGSLAPITSSILTTAGPARSSLPPLLRHSRSRDALEWQSICESTAHREDELTAQAEREAKGSAEAAIFNILRTTPSMSASSPPNESSMPAIGVLQPNTSKRNAPMSRSHHSQGGVEQKHKRVKLGRATSSVARMQTVSNSSRLNVGQLVDPVSKPAKENRKKMDVAALVTTVCGNNDSDKENWSPDDENCDPESHPFGSRRRRPLPSAASEAKSSSHVSARRGLYSRSNTAPVSLLLGSKGGRPSSVDIFEDSDGGSPRASEGNGTMDGPLRLASNDKGNIERYIPADISPSKKPDMECVAGLLSLSQGAWNY